MKERIAIPFKDLWPHPPKHVAKCNYCKWREETRSRAKATRAAAAHIEDTGHDLVCIEAVQIDWLMAVPNFRKYEDRRVRR